MFIRMPMKFVSLGSPPLPLTFMVIPSSSSNRGATPAATSRHGSVKAQLASKEKIHHDGSTVATDPIFLDAIDPPPCS
jgi:hypothetical protein